MKKRFLLAIMFVVFGIFQIGGLFAQNAPVSLPPGVETWGGSGPQVGLDVQSSYYNALNEQITVAVGRSGDPSKWQIHKNFQGVSETFTLDINGEATAVLLTYDSVIVAGCVNSEVAGLSAATAGYDPSYNGDQDGLILRFSLYTPLNLENVQSWTYLGTPQSDCIADLKERWWGEQNAIGVLLNTRGSGLPLDDFGTPLEGVSDGYLGAFSTSLAKFFDGAYLGGEKADSCVAIISNNMIYCETETDQSQSLALWVRGKEPLRSSCTLGAGAYVKAVRGVASRIEYQLPGGSWIELALAGEVGPDSTTAVSSVYGIGGDTNCIVQPIYQSPGGTKIFGLAIGDYGSEPEIIIGENIPDGGGLTDVRILRYNPQNNVVLDTAMFTGPGREEGRALSRVIPNWEEGPTLEQKNQVVVTGFTDSGDAQAFSWMWSWVGYKIYVPFTSK